MDTLGGQTIDAYDSGGVDTATLQAKLPEAWRRVLADPADRHSVAAALGVAAGDLDKIGEPPVRIEAGRSFIGAGTAALEVVTWIGSDIVLGAFTGLARDEVKRRIQQVWAIMKPRLCDLFDQHDPLGPPSSADDVGRD